MSNVLTRGNRVTLDLYGLTGYTDIMKPHPRPGRPGRPRGEPTVLLPVKMTPEQRIRFKVICTDHGKTYAGMIVEWMDNYEQSLKAKKAGQVHPLHIPTGPVSIYPGARSQT